MQNRPTVIDHFSEAAKVYDEKNRQLAPIIHNIHFLIRLILRNAPAKARVLWHHFAIG
jgi:tRNA (cmo5U34)-methyltransferase